MGLKHTPLLPAELRAEDLTDAERGLRSPGRGSTALRHGAAGTGSGGGGGTGEGSYGRVAASPCKTLYPTPSIRGSSRAERRVVSVALGSLTPWRVSATRMLVVTQSGCDRSSPVQMRRITASA